MTMDVFAVFVPYDDNDGDVHFNLKELFTNLTDAIEYSAKYTNLWCKKFSIESKTFFNDEFDISLLNGKNFGSHYIVTTREHLLFKKSQSLALFHFNPCVIEKIQLQ
jgi:hypothetical protein